MSKCRRFISAAKGAAHLLGPLPSFRGQREMWPIQDLTHSWEIQSSPSATEGTEIYHACNSGTSSCCYAGFPSDSVTPQSATAPRHPVCAEPRARAVPFLMILSSGLDWGTDGGFLCFVTLP